MSSRFVSGGTNEQPIERDGEWLKAQQELDAVRREKQDSGKQGEHKTLYDALQHNKAAKQEAFEESIKLRNQFQALKEDDIEFLDSVRQSERAKEEAIRQETNEHLERFRQHRDTAEQYNLADAATSEIPQAGGPGLASSDRQWSVSGKKRRRTQDKAPLRGVKVRKSSASENDLKLSALDGLDHSAGSRKTLTKFPDPAVSRSTNDSRSAATESVAHGLGGPTETNKPRAATKLGLAAYGSDSD